MFSRAWCSPKHNENIDESEFQTQGNINCLLEGKAYKGTENDIIGSDAFCVGGMHRVTTVLVQKKISITWPGGLEVGVAQAMRATSRKSISGAEEQLLAWPGDEMLLLEAAVKSPICL